MHDADTSPGKHELYLICDDIHSFVRKMAKRSVACDPIAERGWGSVSSVTLPSGIKVGIYEAHHARPVAKRRTARALRKTAKAVRKATKKAAKKSRS